MGTIWSGFQILDFEFCAEKVDPSLYTHTVRPHQGRISSNGALVTCSRGVLLAPLAMVASDIGPKVLLDGSPSLMRRRASFVVQSPYAADRGASCGSGGPVVSA